MIKVLIVDDSPLMRRLLTEILSDAGFEAHIARSGGEAIERIHTLIPDVVTLDIHMPDMDGLTCLDRIMLERPTPVVMVSALTSDGAEETLRALDLGAVDFVPKPGGAISLEIEKVASRIVETVANAAQAKLPRTARLAERLRTKRPAPDRTKARSPARPLPDSLWTAREGEGLVLVGSSTGGPPALEALLQPLPADFRWPIVIAQHMPASFTAQLANRLDRLCAITVVEVSKTVPLEPGHAYVGRGNADIVIARRRGRLVALAAPEAEEFIWHPSVDRLVESARVCVAPERLIGVLMTGMGSDGAKAMTRLKNEGGLTIAEAEESAVIWGMPGALVEQGGASRIAVLTEIGNELLAAAR